MREICRLAISLLFLFSIKASFAATVAGDVREALSQHSEVRVMVLLADSERLRLDRDQLAASVDALLATLPRGNVRLERRFHTVPALALTIDTDGLRAIENSPGVGAVSLDPGGSAQLVQSLPLAQFLPVQGMGLTGQGEKVVVIDSGIRLDHQSFAGRIVDQACFCTTCCPNGQATQLGAGSAAHSHSHGTNVAGIAVGGGGVGGVPAGAATQASIIPIRVLDANGSFCCSSDIVAALDWVNVNHPDATVANLSLGTNTGFQGHCDGATAFTQAYASVIDSLFAQGVSVTVSSGNNASNINMQAPACVQNAFSVAAVWDGNVGPVTILGCTDAATAADQMTCFSNLSTTTDLAAPGAPVTAAGIGSATGASTFYGTSQAAPMVAGCIALLKQSFPGVGPTAIQSALRASAVQVTRPPVAQTYPRLNCMDAWTRLDRLFANGFQ